MVIGLRRAVLACFVLAAAAAGCHRKVTEAHFSLENGLRVDLLATARGDKAALALLFDVGADHDPPGRSGMSHLVEHLFATSGWPDKPARTIKQMDARYGHGFHAATGADFTLYAVEVPAERIIEETDDAAFRMSQLAPTESDLTRERARLLDEIAALQVRDDVSAAMTRAAESVRPSRGGGLRGGVAAEIQKITLEEVEAFRRAHYGGSTARLVIAGRFDVEEVSKRIRAGFADAPAGKPPVPRAPAGSRVTGTLVMSEAPTAVALAVPVPEPKDPLYAAFLVLAARITKPSGARWWTGDFAPLARPDVLFVSGFLPLGLIGQTPEQTAFSMRVEVNAIVVAPLDANEVRLMTQTFGGVLGMAEMTPEAVAAAPYETAFAAGRRAQLAIDGKALAAAAAAITPEQLHAAANLFDIANSAAVLMAGKPPHLLGVLPSVPSEVKAKNIK